MFYLIVHFTHFNYSCTEGNVLYNNAFHTFYLWLYSIKHLFKNSAAIPWATFYFYLFSFVLFLKVLLLVITKGSKICLNITYMCCAKWFTIMSNLNGPS